MGGSIGSPIIAHVIIAGADQRIPVQDALRIFTMGGAWMTFEEKTKGSIEPGKVADLVFLGEVF